MLVHRPSPPVLVASGLIVMSLLTIALRLMYPSILSRDYVRGGWSGLCIALGILGFYLLRNQKSGHSA